MVKTTAICPQSIRPPRIQAPIGKIDGADQRMGNYAVINNKGGAIGRPDTIGGK
ncbi:hypothetical protein CEV34_4910 [Brucella pseudogrignonensis]|uniref:Uncharacterized protein n=1 Tax=Brucella pseudogrignonensis TaxID=419475 RepID=A0A256G323_9HYPH|nr:hypothetical protein CEV34_4910 [Brucella pseudogrignonensis]